MSASFDPVSEFRAFAAELGIELPDDIIADGKLHRCAGGGKKSSKSSAYYLHSNGAPNGGVGDWRLGVPMTKWRPDIGRKLTSEELKKEKARWQAQRRKAEAQAAADRARAQRKAQAILGRVEPAAGHPYLERKAIQSHGLGRYKDLLVVPVYVNDKATSLQIIAEDGRKRFLRHGAVVGGHWPVGELDGAGAILVAEGVATTCSLHEATGLPAVAAFTAGNLLAVGRWLRAKYPLARLLFCADDDHRTPGNPGLTAARAAAAAVVGSVVAPAFGPDRGEGETDFNDLARRLGPAAVRAAIFAALEGDPAGGDAAAAAPEPEPADADGPIPGVKARPCWRVFDEVVRVGETSHRAGVWYFGLKQRGNDAPIPWNQWVCGPLHIAAVTADQRGENVGRLLKFKGLQGQSWRELAIPMELLKGDCADLRGLLMSLGLETSLAGRNLLTEYLLRPAPKRKVRCVVQVGWAGEGCFVLPDQAIGPQAGDVILQVGERLDDAHTASGTLDEWKTKVAALAEGNPMLLLAISIALAGPLLKLLGAESGGIHLAGDSSCGKSSTIDAGRSVWGGVEFRRSWHSTANGLEGAASLFNDTCLCLDEISEADPREVGATVYALGNGVGKQRASRTGMARTVRRWRTTVLSSGERSLATTMREGGQRAKAGQLVRLLDVPARRAFGAWDDLRGHATGQAFSDALRAATRRYHGTAGRAFLERLTRETRDLEAFYERLKGLPDFAPAGADGQVRRAGARFALYALAGELAVDYGVAPWPHMAATAAARTAFEAWRAGRGSGNGNDEDGRILAAVAGFLDRHGDSRFSPAGVETAAHAMRINRAGWFEDSETDGRVYLFNTEGLREALADFDFTRGLEALCAAGVLPRQKDEGGGWRRLTALKRINGRRVRVYPILGDRLADALAECCDKSSYKVPAWGARAAAEAEARQGREVFEV
jgi:putative DNA primase/helicase